MTKPPFSRRASPSPLPLPLRQLQARLELPLPMVLRVPRPPTFRQPTGPRSRRPLPPPPVALSVSKARLPRRQLLITRPRPRATVPGRSASLAGWLPPSFSLSLSCSDDSDTIYLHVMHPAVTAVCIAISLRRPIDVLPNTYKHVVLSTCARCDHGTKTSLLSGYHPRSTPTLLLQRSHFLSPGGPVTLTVLRYFRWQYRAHAVCWPQNVGKL
jgi:hypothetical protein